MSLRWWRHRKPTRRKHSPGRRPSRRLRNRSRPTCPKSRSFGIPVRHRLRRRPKPPIPHRPRVERPEINTEDVTASLRELLADQDAVERAESMSSADQDALRRYGARVKARLDGAWRKPSELAGLGLVVRVVFDVSEGGRITNVRIRSSSGNGTFDQSVLSAFRRVGAVGPPPDGRSHTFTLTFRMAR